MDVINKNMTKTYGVWDRRGYQYGVWDGRINQYVVVNLHREFRYGSQRPTKDSSQSCHQNSNINNSKAQPSAHGTSLWT